MNIRIIGDVHGFIGNYIEIIEGVDKSIQLGDMGFKDKYNLMLRLMLEKEIKLKNIKHKMPSLNQGAHFIQHVVGHTA